MQRRRSLLVVFAILFSAPGLVACQSAPATAGSAPAESRTTAETSQAITLETARNLANNCFTCHGPNGRSPGAIPSISTLSAEQIADRLKRFKSGATPSTVMGRQARGYTDAEIEAVAAYIATLRK